MENVGNFGAMNPDNEYCSHCSDDTGNLAVSFEKVVSHYTSDFVKRRGLNEGQARKLAEEFVSKLPAWTVANGH